jgi:predicted AAA+ superfamily ATPase
LRQLTDGIMNIPRAVENQIIKGLQPNKVVLLLGARRTGKTYLIRTLMDKLPKERILLLNGEDLTTRQLLAKRTIAHYREIATNYTLVVIDEAQGVPDIGLVLKLMVDEVKGLKLLITGSSMFDLTNKLGEPLTGRKKDFYVFPVSQSELVTFQDTVTRANQLEERLLYGSYPELFNLKTKRQKEDYLQDLTNAYLLKDILMMENLRNSDKLIALLKLIAWQIGHEVSLEELGRNLQISKNTVERYLDLLSKVFVIYKVSGFSRNLRKEIVKTKRWYFYDNGIRNAIISNFQSLNLRNDTGMLWENFLAAERLKLQHSKKLPVSNYFWRTHDRQEIDWVEDRGGKLFGYEFKWSSDTKVKAPKGWRENYPSSSFKVIHPENYQEFVLRM